MQPDFLFTGDTRSISIEMKVEAKSCTDQVLKYALLALAVEHKEPSVKQHSLVLLGKGSFSSFGRERFGSIEELRVSLEARKDSFLYERPRHLLQYKLRFDEIVSSLEIGFLSYEQLASLLRNEEIGSSTEISGVYGKLLRGLLIELVCRKLASAEKRPALMISLLH